MGNASSAVLENIVQGSNCTKPQNSHLKPQRTVLIWIAVDRDEVERIRKRFMKLDKVRGYDGELVT